MSFTGLSEFLVADKSKVRVAYTVTTDEMIKMLEDGSWLPEAALSTLDHAA